MAFRTPKLNPATCPFCLMKRRALRNAFIGMALSATVLSAAILTALRLGGV